MTILMALLACGGPATEPDEEVVPEFVGTYRVASFDTGTGCDPTEPGDWGGTHAQIEVGSFFGFSTIEVYVCTSETECDTEFSEYFLEFGDATSAEGEVTAWSQSGDTCSLTWNTAALVMNGANVEITRVVEHNADIVNGADLDECELELESYAGAIECSESDRLVLEPI